MSTVVLDTVKAAYGPELEKEMEKPRIQVEDREAGSASLVLDSLSSALTNPGKQTKTFGLALNTALSSIVETKLFAQLCEHIDSEKPVRGLLDELSYVPLVDELGTLWSTVRDSEGESAGMSSMWDESLDDFAVHASTQQALALVMAQAKRGAPDKNKAQKGKTRTDVTAQESAKK